MISRRIFSCLAAYIRGAAGFPGWLIAFGLFLSPSPLRAEADQQGLCLDGFCIGQGIEDARFENIHWLTPKQNYNETDCVGVGCRPEVAFRGYPPKIQSELAAALRWNFGINNYNIITDGNLEALRQYHYECNPSARGMWGERRFLGIYRSMPSGYFTVIGLRLIDAELRVYRIARQYPYHNQGELVSLAQDMYATYGSQILFYRYLSSNAYADVVKERKDGWFGRSTMFNTTDLSDNAAELVVIDPATRALLLPSSMPESGEIKPLPMRLPKECARSLPLQ